MKLKEIYIIPQTKYLQVSKIIEMTYNPMEVKEAIADLDELIYFTNLLPLIYIYCPSLNLIQGSMNFSLCYWMILLFFEQFFHHN